MDKARAKLWRTQLRQFKLHFRTLAKLGILEVWCREEGATATTAPEWSHPDWDHPAWQQVFHDCIVAGVCSELLARGIIRTQTTTWFNRTRPTPKGAIEELDRLYAKYSRQLRVKFGESNAVPPLPEGEQGSSDAVPQGRSDDLPAEAMWPVSQGLLHLGDLLAAAHEDAQGAVEQQPTTG